MVYRTKDKAYSLNRGESIRVTSEAWKAHTSSRTKNVKQLSCAMHPAGRWLPQMQTRPQHIMPLRTKPWNAVPFKPWQTIGAHVGIAAKRDPLL